MSHNTEMCVRQLCTAHMSTLVHDWKHWPHFFIVTGLTQANLGVHKAILFYQPGNKMCINENGYVCPG